MTTPLTLVKMLVDLSLSEEQFRRVLLRAPYSYKTYTIAKKNGGVRVISQPARETKYVQHWLIKNVFSLLPVHCAASAYVKGGSIRKNAMTHCGNEYIVKLDFKNFFPSITLEDLLAHFLKHLSFLGVEEAKSIARLCCINKSGTAALSIGSPASPVLSNSIMFEFDELVSEWASNNGFVYTRYADDLTISTNRAGVSSLVIPAIESILTDLVYPKISLNPKKSIHLSKRGSRRVTGLVITNDSTLSLGRNRKREISALVHKFGLGLLEDVEIFRLQGLMGFAADVEPIFLRRLSEKYGVQVVRDLLKRKK